MDASSAVTAVKSLEFQAILRGTAEFQSVDLNLLNSDAAKVCFFVNTLNLLIAHASLIRFAVSSETNEIEAAPVCRHASLTHLTNALSSSGDETREDEPVPVTSLERIAFLKQHSYSIGQIGPVRCETLSLKTCSHTLCFILTLSSMNETMRREHSLRLNPTLPHGILSHASYVYNFFSYNAAPVKINFLLYLQQ